MGRVHSLDRFALAPFGGSVSGADRSAEIAPVHSLDHCLVRARTERAGVRWPHRRRADRFFTDSLAPCRRSTASSFPTRRSSDLELGGLLRQHPLRRSTATAVASSALAPFWWQRIRRGPLSRNGPRSLT